MSKHLIGRAVSAAVMLLLAGCPAPQDTGGGNDNDANVNEGDDPQNDNTSNDNGAALDNENGNDNDNGITLAIGQPEQPTQGPGSSNYVHQQVRTSKFGSGTEAYFLYEPAEPTPESAAPVVAFLHGFGGVNPSVYGPWIAHIVRKGNIVVYPLYQTSLGTPPAVYTPSALTALTDAYELLASPDHVDPDPVNFALVGHSVGGVLAANVAAGAQGAGLPAPRALMLTAASDTDVPGPLGDNFDSILDDVDYGLIPADVLMLGVVGNDDNLALDVATVAIFNATPQIPSGNKEIVRLFSDDYGEPPLIANHNAAASFDPNFDSGDEPFPGFFDGESTALPADALDFFGYWKLFEGLTDAAFFGNNREFALGNTPAQTFLGVWDDGTPVTPAKVGSP